MARLVKPGKLQILLSCAARSNGRISGTAGAARNWGCHRARSTQIKRLKINNTNSSPTRDLILIYRTAHTFLIAKEFLNNQDSSRN